MYVYICYISFYYQNIYYRCIFTFVIFHSIIRIFTTDVSLHLLYFILLLEYLLQMYLYICIVHSIIRIFTTDAISMICILFQCEQLEAEMSSYLTLQRSNLHHAIEVLHTYGTIVSQVSITDLLKSYIPMVLLCHRLVLLIY